MEKACHDSGALEVFVTDDPDEGELFVQARRMVIPAVEELRRADARGRRRARAPAARAAGHGIAEIAARQRPVDPGDRPRR